MMVPELYIDEKIPIKCVCPFCGEIVTARKSFPNEDIPFDEPLMDFHLNGKDKICDGAGDYVRPGTRIDNNEELSLRFVYVPDSPMAGKS